MSKKKLPKKPFCGWSRSDIENNPGLIANLTTQPAFACRKCARVSNSSKNVCKPMALPTPEPLKLSS